MNVLNDDQHEVKKLSKKYGVSPTTAASYLAKHRKRKELLKRTKEASSIDDLKDILKEVIREVYPVIKEG